MKKIMTLACAACMALSACATPAPTVAPAATADSPLSGLGSLLGGGKGSSDKDNSNSGSGLGNILGGVLGSVLGTDKISPDRLVGTWNYTGPAVCFQSENFLQKAGGAAMAATIEDKLSGYYDKFGLNKVTLTVDEQHNFKLNLGILKTTGTVTVEDDDVYFNFTALGTISLGKMKTYVTMTGNKQMSLMFDVSKLLKIMSAVGSVTNSATVKTATSFLNSYDGLCAGFKLSKI